MNKELIEILQVLTGAAIVWIGFIIGMIFYKIINK